MSPFLLTRRGLATLMCAWMLGGLAAPCAQAADAVPAATATTIRTAVEGWLKGRYKVDEVRKAPVGSLYEVRIGTDLLYVDESAQFAFVEGNLVDLRTGRNFTRERADELSAINFQDLPLQLAFKQVQGNGKRVLAVFEDPNCGYCKQLRRDLAQLKDVTIYTYVLPILSADSETKARKVLCADDKGRAWNELMLSGKVPGNGGTCDTPLASIKELAQKLGITATPTMFFPSGKRVAGYLPAPRFEKVLDENNAVARN